MAQTSPVLRGEFRAGVFKSTLSKSLPRTNAGAFCFVFPSLHKTKTKGSGTPASLLSKPPRPLRRGDGRSAPANLPASHRGSRLTDFRRIRLSVRPGFLGGGLMSVTHHRLSQSSAHRTRRS